VTIPGRVESRMTVPTGGAAFSASNGAQSAAYSGTIPAANYFHTAAGGVSGLLATFQQYLNDNVQGYPTAAAAMQAMLGFGGDWGGGQGWLLNEASGNLAPTFGATTLTATSLTYGTPGPSAGIDKAIGFDAGTDNADGGNIFDVGASDDLTVAWVGYLSAVPGGSVSIITKFTTTGWYVNVDAGGNLNFGAYRAGPVNDFNAPVAAPIAGWYVGIATIDRGTGKGRLGIRTLAGVTAVSAEQAVSANSFTTAGAFRLGQRADAGAASTGSLLAAVYAVKGSGIASGLSANLSTALTNFANAINSRFTVSLDTTTGLATISNSFWPSSLAFTNTSLRDVLGFEYDFDYPQTPAQIQSVVGGIWTDGVGYLCNESGGNLASIFGTPALLTPASSPTYSQPGARGGSDKAAGFNAATAGYFDGGNSLDVGASDDLLVIAVVRFTSAPGTVDLMISKGAFGDAATWVIFRNGNQFWLRLRTGGVNLDIATAAFSPVASEPFILIAALDRAAGKGRIAVRSLLTGTQAVSAETAFTGTLSNVSTFRLGNQSGYGASTGVGHFSAVYVTRGPGVAAGATASIATALSSFAAYMKGQTSTKHARGLWIPDHVLNLEGDPKRAPIVSDARSSMSPTGQVVTLVGNTYRRHRGLVWSHVKQDRVWDGENTLENSTWEEFVSETQLGLGSSWFTPGSLVQIYYYNAGGEALLGADATIPGWSIVGVRSIEPQKAVGNWTGLWRIELPQIVAAG
jgi:hypothetical protein